MRMNQVIAYNERLHWHAHYMHNAEYGPTRVDDIRCNALRDAVKLPYSVHSPVVAVSSDKTHELDRLLGTLTPFIQELNK